MPARPQTRRVLAGSPGAADPGPRRQQPSRAPAGLPRTPEVERAREGVQHAQAARLQLAQQVADQRAWQARRAAQEARDRRLVRRMLLRSRARYGRASRRGRPRRARRAAAGRRAAPRGARGPRRAGRAALRRDVAGPAGGRPASGRRRRGAGRARAACPRFACQLRHHLRRARRLSACAAARPRLDPVSPDRAGQRCKCRAGARQGVGRACLASWGKPCARPRAGEPPRRSPASRACVSLSRSATWRAPTHGLGRWPDAGATASRGRPPQQQGPRYTS